MSITCSLSEGKKGLDVVSKDKWFHIPQLWQDCVETHRRSLLSEPLQNMCHALLSRRYSSETVKKQTKKNKTTHQQWHVWLLSLHCVAQPRISSKHQTTTWLLVPSCLWFNALLNTSQAILYTYRFHISLKASYKYFLNVYVIPSCGSSCNADEILYRN